MGRPPLPIGERGNIKRKEQADGTWQALCRYRDADGTTRRVTAYGPSGQKAENALKRKLKYRTTPGVDTITPETTVKELAGVWLSTVDQSDGTKDTYRLSIDTHIIPLMGGVRLREVTTGRADAFLTKVGQKRTKTVRGRQVTVGGSSAAKTARTVLRMMLSMAVRYDVLVGNPVRETPAPKSTPQKIRALTMDEYKRLRTNVIDWQERGVMGPRKTPLVDKLDLLVATGVRPGEMLAFMWDDVDLEARIITVSGTVVRTSVGGLHRQPYTKTRHDRTLSLPPFAVTMLRLRKMRNDPDTNPDGLIFPSNKGTPIEAGNFRRQWTAARGDEFDWVKPGHLRKTVATIISAASGSKTASEQLGHSTDAVTLRHYVQRSPVAPDSTELLERFGG